MGTGWLDDRDSEAEERIGTMGARLVHFLFQWFSTVLYDLEKHWQTRRGYGVGVGEYWRTIGTVVDVFFGESKQGAHRIFAHICTKPASNGFMLSRNAVDVVK